MNINKTNGYQAGIDGLRAIAVLAVVFYHMDYFPFFKGGFIGVDIFFIISGYVISKSIYNRPLNRLSSYLTDFYKRRFIRIIPALVVCLITTFILTTLFIPDSWLSNTIDRTGFSAFFGYSNFALVWFNDGYFSPKVDFNPFLHTWSLAVEEQFYLIFPLIFFVWLKFGKNKSMIGFISRLLLIIIGILSLIFAFFETTSHHNQAFYLLPSRFWELAAGALLFQFHSKNIILLKNKKISQILMLTGLLLIGIGFIFADQNDFPYPWAIIPVIATIFIIHGLISVNESSLSYKFLNSSIMIYIGKISYSLYLWHWPVATILRWTIGFQSYWHMIIYMVISFILAILSFHFIETPIRTNKILLKQKNWKIIISSFSILLITFLIARFLVESKSSLSLSVTKENYIWRSGKYKKDEVIKGISKNPKIIDRKIFALGDSHTAAYRTMLHIVSSHLGIEVYEYEEGGCAIAGLLKPMSELKNCELHYKNSFQEIKKLSKPGDIVFLASFRMPELSDSFEVIDITKVLAEYNSEKEKRNRYLALQEADQIIKDFENLGLHVLIVAPEPVLKAPPYRCSDWFNKMNPIGAPGLTISRDLLLEIRKPVMNSLNILQKNHPDLFVWDPLYVLCKEENFSAYDENGLPLFFDGDHFSANGNRKLVSSFNEKILTIWK